MSQSSGKKAAGKAPPKAEKNEDSNGTGKSYTHVFQKSYCISSNNIPI